jgi:integrase
MASLLYGSGLRLMECLRLRVKNLEAGQWLRYPHRAGIIGP